MMVKILFQPTNYLKNIIMRKFIGYKLIGLALIVTGLAACDTASQDVEPIVSPETYPVATIAPATTSTTIKEGDTLTYIITTDKMIDRAVTFTAVVTGGTAGADDFTTAPAVLQPYSTHAELYVIANEDNMPEIAETLNLKISIESIAERYIVNPNSVLPTASLTIENKNDPTLLTIVFSWATDDDMDMVIWSDTETYPHTEWGDGGATASNPEFDTSIWLSDPVGTYYVNVMDWDAGIDFDYTFTLGYPDGSVEVITGIFTGTDKSGYVNDQWTAWGGSYDSYRILQVVNDGTKFTVTEL